MRVGTKCRKTHYNCENIVPSVIDTGVKQGSEGDAELINMGFTDLNLHIQLTQVKGTQIHVWLEMK